MARLLASNKSGSSFNVVVYKKQLSPVAKKKKGNTDSGGKLILFCLCNSSHGQKRRFPCRLESNEFHFTIYWMQVP